MPASTAAEPSSHTSTPPNWFFFVSATSLQVNSPGPEEILQVSELNCSASPGASRSASRTTRDLRLASRMARSFSQLLQLVAALIPRAAFE